MFYSVLNDKGELIGWHEEIVSAIENKDADKAAGLLNRLLTHGEQVLKLNKDTDI